MRYSKDQMQAEDYLQDSFMMIFEKLSYYKSDKGAFQTWISRVTVNTILMDKRKAKNREKINATIDHEALENIGYEDSDNELFNAAINKEALLEAIRSIPEKYRDVLNLYVFDEWSHAQIATALNITEDNSRIRFARAKKALKKILKQKMIYS